MYLLPYWTPMTTIPVTTPTNARRLIAAARTVAREGRTATVASVAGSAINRLIHDAYRKV
jgi:hypothetical protein